MAKADKTDLTLHSGWCMKWPVGEHNQAEHDKCPMHFSTRSCACTCGHKGERSLESRGTVYTPYIPPKSKTIKVKEETNDEDN
jgi:hypothetical protein